MAACNVIVLCMAEGLLLGRGAGSPGMAIGEAPLRAGKKHSPVLAVIVVSSCSEGGVTLFRVCFCWQLFISVCLYFCLACELVLCALSQPHSVLAALG